MGKCWIGTVGPLYGSIRCDTPASDLDDMVRLGDLGDVVYNSKARVYLSSNSSLASSSTPQLIAFNTVSYDEDSNYTSGLGLFSAPVAGYYLVTVKIAVDFTGITSSCTLALYIYKSSGMSEAMHSGYGRVIVSGSTYQSIMLTDIVQCVEDIGIRAKIYQDSGVTKTIIGGSPYSYMTIARLA